MELSMKLIIGGAVMVVGTILVGFVSFQTLVNFVVKDQTALRKRNEIRGIYLKIPFPLNFKIYFFNVTNPMEVHNGATPILQQVGPYYYDEYKEKINVVDNDAEDSLQYDAFDTYQFNKTLSGSLSDEDYVTIIHPLLVGMVNTVTATSPALLSIVNQAITHIFNEPKTIYLTDKVKNIMFNGMELNCQGSDFASKAVCTQIKSQMKGVKESPTQKNVLLFSLIGPRNATIADTIKIMRGIKNYRDLGRVLEVNGKKDIGLWGTEECNRFKGTDGWIIPPLLKPEEGIKCYTTHLCRNIALDYVRDDVVKGINVRRYEGNLGDQQNNPADKCYCPESRPCLKTGTFELSKCVGAPIIASLPHFLDADESLLTQVKGLSPVHEDHIMNVNIDPMTSAPISVRIRVQMNLEIAPNPKITIMNNLTTALHPIFWLEDGLDLEGPLFTKISNIFILLKMAHIMKWLFLVASIGVFGYGSYTHFKSSKKVKITPVHQRTTTDDNPVKRSTNELISQLRNEGKNGYTNNIMSGHEFDRYK
ncbi:sensory neuron membrane protein 1-like isoform X1 [Diabrotica virgifera virgifera]|uniref:Sensory neuron membrane protein 1-like isoform X1 n=2 Tax=Diabrotica virgifera virgifera TaxID=50390 RepID=A0A6P7GQS9_DIAVI|nr:sensory neuron membrane protein 1-like isoform X1 [Diabrotica virgifera virgifera]